MTSRKKVTITINEGAKIVEDVKRIDGKVRELTLEGRFEIEQEQLPNLRKLTAKEKHDYMNSMRSLVSKIFRILPMQIEQLTDDIFMEYEKMIVRSYLKRNTPKLRTIYVDDFADDNDLDVELLLDVLNTDFKIEFYAGTDSIISGLIQVRRVEE